ncbi:double-stranded RNA binding motif domain-containing protein [Aspergillus melleus]|uniref:double-stranded RNA binding motif domain-containing protein n=1 Tax=Aspergillus melleus TaxID=138277 RepID=UPI001E8DCE75|nr:uncharacterized protein LDX57_008655 [Aspergillus melleus]KAH8430994.1 hypothetical protein LDX57_008655 [Aspergillus melleus]
MNEATTKDLKDNLTRFAHNVDFSPIFFGFGQKLGSVADGFDIEKELYLFLGRECKMCVDHRSYERLAMICSVLAGCFSGGLQRPVRDGTSNTDNTTNYTGLLKEKGDKEITVPTYSAVQERENPPVWLVSAHYGAVVGYGSATTKKAAKNLASKKVWLALGEKEVTKRL